MRAVPADSPGGRSLRAVPAGDPPRVGGRRERTRARVPHSTDVASRGLEFEGAVMRLTVSAGVVVRAEGDADADDMMRRADALLYAAKRAGRNRTEG